MKKQSLLMNLLLILVTSMFFISCSKESLEENIEVPKTFSLSGKNYGAFAYTSKLFGVQYDVYWVYRFISETEFERTSRENNLKGSLIGEPEYGTYKLYTNGDKAIKVVLKEKGSTESKTGTFVTNESFRIGSSEYYAF